MSFCRILLHFYRIIWEQEYVVRCFGYHRSSSLPKEDALLDPDVIAHVNRLTRNLLVCVMLTSAIQSFWSDYVFSLLWDFLQRFPLFLFLDLISAYIFLYCFLVLNNLDIDILHLRKVQNFLIVSS